MGGTGFTELLLLAVIALIVVGPHRLPKIARTAGRLTRQARNAWQGLQSELQAELDADHNRKIMETSQARTDASEDSDPVKATNDDSDAAQAPNAEGGEDRKEDNDGKQDEPADRH